MSPPTRRGPGHHPRDLDQSSQHPHRHHEVTATLDALAGHQIPGGCDHCDAYQSVARMAGIPIGPGAGAFTITMHHDEWCPWLVRHENRAARRAAVRRAKQRRRR